MLEKKFRKLSAGRCKNTPPNILIRNVFWQIYLAIALMVIVSVTLSIYLIPMNSAGRFIIIIVPGCLLLYGLATLPVITIPDTINDLTVSFDKPGFFYSDDKKAILKLLEKVPSWEPQFFWRWDPLFPAIYVTDLQNSKKTLEMRFQPISANPKVRQLLLRVGYEIKGGVENGLLFLQQFYPTIASGIYEETISSASVHFHGWLKYQLFEFNEKYGKELAELYNPMDEAQQKQFRKLLCGFINPLMPELWRGRAILTGASFSL